MSQSDLNSIFLSPDCQDAGHRRGWLGIAEFIWEEARRKYDALACIEAAKPADALGNLPVVAYFMKFADGSEEYSRYLPSQADYEDIPHHITKLTDNAKASAEIAKRDAEIERLKYQLGGGELAAQELERQVDYLRAKLAGVDGLAQALRKAECQIMALAPAGYIAPALGAIHAALATYEAAQGEK